MALPNTRERARELVEKVAAEHGHLDEARLEFQDNRVAFCMRNPTIGSSNSTPVGNLHTSRARFVFELLQNADNNSYTKAEALGEAPYVSFHVFRHRIVVECNEDGFTDTDLEGICLAGRKSKPVCQGHAGEKRMGFKSVFTAAWKAHIRSGHLSFSVSDMTDDLGNETIVPRWEEPVDDGYLSMTRLTLHLHGSQDTENLDILCQTQETTLKQLQELRDTILLFTKKLKMIRFAFHRIDGTQKFSATYSVERPSVSRAVLTGIIVQNGTERKYVKHYHTTLHQETQLQRQNSQTCHGQVAHTPDVALAFPVSDTSYPISEPQQIVSAYSPVRSAGFTFFIHADFVTDASGQDIVKDSQYNIAILDPIADAFCRAVNQFCKHSRLCFAWISYLPDRNDHNWGALWLSLIDKIATRLSQIPVLYCHRKHDRHRIEDLVRLRSDFYEDGEPLLEDGNSENIISQRYLLSELEVLMSWGLRFADLGHFLNWLSEDLDRGTQSRMRSTETTDNWHSQTAKLLHEPFLKNRPKYKAKLKTMALLPLEGGDWVSAATGPVFFPGLDGIDVPPCTGLRIINKTITNVDRIRLFRDLGVQELPISLVRSNILEMYSQPEFLPNLSVHASKQHLMFLYLTQHLKSAAEPPYSHIVLFDQYGHTRNPSKVIMSMVTEWDPDSPWIFQKGRGWDTSAFLHDQYFRNSPQKPPNQALTWVEWLHVHLNIAKYASLGDTDLPGSRNHLHGHRSGGFLGALQIQSQQDSKISPEFIACLQNTFVLCRGGQETILKDVFFPTRKLEDLVKRFLEPCAFFPFLWTHIETDGTIPHNWHGFLRKVGVGIPLTDLEFALHMLRSSVRALRTGDSRPTGIGRLFSLYSYIQAQNQMERVISEEKNETIRKMFVDEKAICIPQSLSTENIVWASPKECVWGGPRELITKFALRTYYEALPFFCGDKKQDLAMLFTSTLGIPDCTLEIYVNELKSLKSTHCHDIIKVLYREIDRLCGMQIEQGASLDWLKGQFEYHSLVYVASNDLKPPSWHRPSRCCWPVDARFGNKVSLDQDYMELQWLFVRVLDLKALTLKVAVDQLNEAGCRQIVSVGAIKTHLVTVNSLLRSAKDAQQPKLNREARIFPVKYPKGGVQCVSAQVEFSIVDLEFMRSLFEDDVKFLDFSLEEVYQLQPFIRWAQLDHKRISRCRQTFESVQTSDAERVSHPDLQFRHRAHAILRTAKHFRSPRVRTTKDTNALYELLRDAKIFATDAISIQFGLSQDGVLYKARGGPVGMHICEDGPNLTVYLPRRNIPQQHSFRKQLPEKLLQWLMTEPGSGICGDVSLKGMIVMKDIWNTPLATVPTTMDEWGIIRISTPNLDPVVLESSSESDSGVFSERSTGERSGSQGAMKNGTGTLDNDLKVLNSRCLASNPPNTCTAGNLPGEDSGKSFASSATQGAPITVPIRLKDPDWDATK